MTLTGHQHHITLYGKCVKYLSIYYIFIRVMIIIHRALFYAGGSSYTGSCISGTVISTNGVTGTSSGDVDPGN